MQAERTAPTTSRSGEPTREQVPPDVPDRTGQEWDRKTRRWVSATPGPVPAVIPAPDNAQMVRVRENRILRDERGRIKKGSGNLNTKSKRGRKPLAYREHLASLEHEALLALQRALRSKHESVSTAAAQDILDRIHGKATQHVKDETPVRLIIKRDF